MNSPRPVLVLPPRQTPDATALWRAAIDLGLDIERLSGWRPPPELASREVILYGEPLFAEVVAEALGLALLEPPTDWLTSLPEELLRRQVRRATLGETRAMTTPVFVKPEDGKGLPARVYPNGADLPSPDVFPDDLRVLVAEPVTWTCEVRCFVNEGRVVTLSPYLRMGVLARDEDGEWESEPGELSTALAFAETVLRDPRAELPPAVALDVGLIGGRGWAVVESNAAWGSGIYGCDPKEVLRAAQRACRPRAKLTADDRRWVVVRGT